MQTESLCYWQVFDGKAKVDENQTNENVEDAVEDLRSLLDDLEGNSVTVKISNRNNEEKAKGGRNYIHYDYTVKLVQQRSEANGNLSLLKELYELKNQIQIDRLTNDFEKKLAEATKKDKDSPSDRAIAAILPKILESFAGKVTPGIAGIGEEVTTENLNKANVKQVIRNMVNQFSKIDPDYLEVLAAIVTIAKNKPTEYATYKPILLSMAK